MKRFGILAGTLLLVGWNSSAAPLNGRVKEVKIYPQGAYITLSVPVSLKSGADQEIVFPDLWYADPATVELKLLPGTVGVDYVMESQPAVKGSDVELQQVNLLRQDTLLARKARLEADSMVLMREIEFLSANAKQEAQSVSQLAAAERWMRDQYGSVYESQRRNREARAALDRELTENRQQIRQVNSQARSVMLVRARVSSPRAQRAEFELSYFANAAQWEPVYFFRFEPGGTTAELDYRAAVWQWSRFAWDRVPALLSYGSPMRALHRPTLSRNYVHYSKPNKGDIAVELSKFGGNYVEEAEPHILDLAVQQEIAFDSGMPRAARVEVSENDISYRLGRPLTLASSSDNARIRQTVELRRDTMPVLYEYEATPKINTNVLLLARIPEWQKLHLTNGRINVFCDGRMLGQSNLSVRNTQDTLVLPLMLEPQVVVERNEVGNYRERVFGAKQERSQTYQIRIKNNKDFPVNLTVKDQYPVSNTDEVEVTLTENAGATVDAKTGMLTWNLHLAPGEEQTLTFSYSIRYPKGGTIHF